MDDKSFIHIRTRRFPLLPNEPAHWVGRGSQGQALALHVQRGLQARGYTVPRVFCQDWGWWVDIRNTPFLFGVRIHSGPSLREGWTDYTLANGAQQASFWSWRQLGWAPVRPWAQSLHADLLAMLCVDPEVQLINAACSQALPWENPKP
jgi:hypothetical protein